MADQNQATLGGRVRRLPRDIALALINATAVLIVLAAILAILAVGRVQQAGANLATAATQAVAGQLGATPADVRQRLDTLAAEVSHLATALQTRRDDLAPAARTEIAAIERRLTQLQETISQATAAGPALIDTALRQAGTELGNALAQARRCERTDHDPT